MTISALILTFNEEVNLRGCLDSLHWCDDIVVLDSFSSDATEAIARDYGVRFEQRIFDTYAAQRNHGLSGITYKHPWILMVDADERVTPELVEEMRAAITGGDSTIVLYRFRRKDFFLGQWIKRSGGYPTWFGRLMRPGRVRIERDVNEEYVADGKVGFLNGHLMHFPFNKGFAAWLDKHNRYSSMEAVMKRNGGPGKKFRSGDLLDHDPARRRIAMKALVYALPGRPVIMFLALYLWRGGFLDGRAGLVFCLLRAFYEFMIDCKVVELRLRERGLSL